MFKRVLVANRGEIARRVIRACHALGVEAVAVYSEADADSPHLGEADATICIGGPRSSDSYLDMAALLQAAAQTECQAVHPGYGFVAENALFAEMCRQCKLSFIGPSPGVMRLMGDKATARRTMQAAGMAVVPGSDDLVADVARARELAGEMGYPVLLKATAGGGGKGMRVCRDEAALAVGFEQASLEADKAFGNPGLYLERFIEGGRHIEFQFMADGYGAAVHLGERECSVQRAHQKLLEESPSPVIDATARAELGARVCQGVRAIGYAGAGTMELLRAPDGALYFMEVNTRLQVEHPVTEMVTGLDLVAEQIRIAAGHRLSWRQQDIALCGHAIECRINAEDPFDGFRPCPGVIERFEPPAAVDGVQLRLDTHVTAGYRIPVYYDSMIGKLIAAGRDRDTARRGMLAALEQLVIEPVKTTVPLCRMILSDPRFASGQYDTTLAAALLTEAEGPPAAQG